MIDIVSFGYMSTKLFSFKLVLLWLLDASNVISPNFPKFSQISTRPDFLSVFSYVYSFKTMSEVRNESQKNSQTNF